MLDEPTNDLDLETLDLLENLLVEYEGTLVLVSHDRDFLDNVVTSTLVFEGDSQIGEYIGGYADWVREKEKRVLAAALRAEAAKRAEEAKPAAKPARKLTNKERKELEVLPARIEALEAEQAALIEKLADVGIYRRDPTGAVATKSRLDEIEQEHATSFARWEELEAVKNAAGN